MAASATIERSNFLNDCFVTDAAFQELLDSPPRTLATHSPLALPSPPSPFIATALATAGSHPLSWAALAGVLGALAAAAIKAALQPPAYVPTSLALPLLLLLRALCLAAGLVCNAAMMRAFARGLQSAGSAPATLTSAAANLLTSALLGVCLFGERLGSRWTLGTGLVLVGLSLLHRGVSDARKYE